MKIETLKLHNGETVKYIKKGLASGKKMFLKEGFLQMPNPNYLIKGRTVVHYNSILKAWIIED